MLSAAELQGRFGPELRQVYLRLTRAQKEYATFNFDRRRAEMRRQDIEHWSESTGSLVYSVQDFLRHAEQLRKGELEKFAEFHRPSSLVNVLKLCLHRGGAAGELMRKNAGVAGLLALSGAMPISFSDGCLLSLTDHLVLVAQSSSPLPPLVLPLLANLEKEAGRRGRALWTTDKLLRVTDAFLLLHPRLDSLLPLTSALAFRTSHSPSLLPTLHTPKLILLAFHSLLLPTSPPNLTSAFESKLKGRIWKWSLDELCIVAAFFLRFHDRRPSFANDLTKILTAKRALLSPKSRDIFSMLTEIE